MRAVVDALAEAIVAAQVQAHRRLQLPRLYSSGGFTCLDYIHQAASTALIVFISTIYPLRLSFRPLQKPPSDCGEYWRQTALRLQLLLNGVSVLWPIGRGLTPQGTFTFVYIYIYIYGRVCSIAYFICLMFSFSYQRKYIGAGCGFRLAGSD